MLGRTAVLVILTFLATLVPGLAGQANADTPITVSQAIGNQSGSATVRGYVVGQPTATDTVITSAYPNDYAIAIADNASQTSTSQMLYVQVPSEFRSQWGLRSNPSLKGKQIDVTGALTAYFSHPGLKSASAFAFSGTTPDPEPDPEPEPGDGEHDDYYASALGKTGEDLRDELHTIISSQTKLSYSAVWEALKLTDQDPNNTSNVLLLYSGRSQSKSTNGGDPNDWNREHVWAKSHGDFGTATGPGTDIHHLRPTDVSVNSTRGNKDFDNGGGTVSECSGCSTDSDSFEPPDAVKGDVARMILYMAIRYEGGDGWADLEPNDLVNNGSNPYMGRISVLLEWNAQDPPSTFEKRRNDVIFEQFQHNRNPFIDHPEWAGAIWN
ncbi:endonuclease I [Nocardioides daedukensis]|uniref:Endonuclease I n=1 Tax=Nocardioides daedukensis TaxID=634462 RepID=A0A7Y9S0R1_9ACTN|nr:endonuclease [Nocardioides daedukensis]NYG60187.1 endonuclease I [Nocardioides daedukensis]